MFALCPGSFVNLLLNYFKGEECTSVERTDRYKTRVALEVRYEKADCLNKLIADFAKKKPEHVLVYDDNNYILKDGKYHTKASNSSENLDMLERGGTIYCVDPANCIVDSQEQEQNRFVPEIFRDIYNYCYETITNVFHNYIIFDNKEKIIKKD